MLPTELVQPAFDRLKLKLRVFAPNYKYGLNKVVAYIERVWFRGTVWNLEGWNCYRRLIRTNNDQEGYHNKLTHDANKTINLELYRLFELLVEKAHEVRLHSVTIRSGLMAP